MFAYLKNFEPLYKKNEALQFSIKNSLIVFYFIISIIMIGPTIDDIYSGATNNDPDATRIGNDFFVFYIVGDLSKEKKLEIIYNPETLEKKYFSDIGGKQYFSYPPMTLLIFEPLSNLPYKTAYFTWVCLSSILLFGILYTITKSYMVILAVLFSPFFWRGVNTGQTGLLGAAIIAFGLYCLWKKKHLLSGMIFGLLIIKPQLIIVLPFTLLLTKEWRVILGGLISSITLIIISYLIYGPEAWHAFFGGIGGSLRSETPEEVNHNISLTIWSIIHFMTSNMTKAVIATSIGAIFALITTGYIWKNTEEIAPRALSLTLFPVFLSPYFHFYDSLTLIITFAIFAKCFIDGTSSPRENLLLLLIWIFSFSVFRMSPASFYYLPIPFLVCLMLLSAKQVKENTIKCERTIHL